MLDPSDEKAMPRGRLSRGERVGLALLGLFSIAVGLIALGKAFATTLHFFGEQATSREEAVAGQALRTALWAMATPLCAWIVLRRRSRAWLGAAVWLGLLAWCASSPWPPSPTNGFDVDHPIWLSSFLPLWSLVGAGFAVAMYAALKSNRRSAVVVTINLSVTAVALLATSHVNLVRHADAERSVPLAEGAAELRALRADRLWASLPRGVARSSREASAARAVWGDRFPTWKSVRLGTAEDRELFRNAVVVAEETEWRLIATSCFESSWEANFVKSLPVGNATLRINVASYTQGVNVFAEIADTRPTPRPGKCWEP
jgi:hypothetical protein